MATAILSTVAVASLLALVALLHQLRGGALQITRHAGAEKLSHAEIPTSLLESALRLRSRFREVLPASLICPDDRSAFKELLDASWAQQACETAPTCVLRPRDAQELAVAVGILKNEFHVWKSNEKMEGTNADGLFAIRGGGHSPVAGAATTHGGVLIDMSLFDTVTISPGGSTVIIGSGCKWTQVYKILEAKGLAVVGGRNSAVGVGGLTLGGGLSFFSPRFGFVCSNIVEYRVVLANGNIVTASATEHPNLWRALKGGSNNFGIVTSFTANAFPATKVWSGFLYMLPLQTTKVLCAFNEYLNRVVGDADGKTYDRYAAGPIACFTYLSKVRIQAIAVNLVHTKLPVDHRKWPECWRSSQFASMWRLWSTCKVRSLASATDELHALNPPGRRQTWGTTTIENDPATLAAAHKAYSDGVQSIREAGIKDVSWTLVLQPLLPDWARKGQLNPLGLNECPDKPLVIIQLTVNWALGEDDALVEGITRTAIEQIDAFATKHQTGHRYRYLNYCGSWQNPFNGYGEVNLEFLRRVSREYDPDGLFQRGCAGGFKLGL